MIRSRLVNYVLYQIGWFCCVLGAAHGFPGAGAAVASALVAAHLMLAERIVAEAKLLLAAALLGVTVESAMACAGWADYRPDSATGNCLAPPWIVVMWIQFATLLRFGLSFLRGRYLLASVLGATGGPLAFWTGMRLGAARFETVSSSLAAIGAIWAVTVPLLLRLSARGGADAGRYRFDRSPGA